MTKIFSMNPYGTNTGSGNNSLSLSAPMDMSKNLDYRNYSSSFVLPSTYCCPFDVHVLLDGLRTLLSFLSKNSGLGVSSCTVYRPL